MTERHDTDEQRLSPTPDQPTPTADDEDQKTPAGERNTAEESAAQEATQEADDNPSN